MENQNIKHVVAIGVGAALFVVIGMLINIPTPIPNTSIQLQYAVVSLFSVIYGPIVGFLVGFLGHTVKDLFYGAPWWSWILSSGIFGLLVGLAKNKLSIDKGVFNKKSILLFNGVQFLANAIVWCLVAPFGDILIYSEPASKVFAQGMIATLVNSLTVAVAGTILIAIYAKTQVKSGSLSKD